MPSARVIHGSCEVEMKSVKSGSVDLIIADPPYDISVQGVEWDTRVPKYMEHARVWLRECERVLRPGGALLLYGSPCRQWYARMSILLEDELAMQLVQHLAWVYTQGGDARLNQMRSYAVRHEQLGWFEKPEGGRTFNAVEAAEQYSVDEMSMALAKGKGRVTVESLRNGRPPRSFIDIPRENSRSKERAHGKHPSMKPLSLCNRLVRVHSNVDDLVLVPFAGSGSEIVAACAARRNVIGIEKCGEYMHLMQKRFAAHGHNVCIEKYVNA